MRDLLLLGACPFLLSGPNRKRPRHSGLRRYQKGVRGCWRRRDEKDMSETGRTEGVANVPRAMVAIDWGMSIGAISGRRDDGQLLRIGTEQGWGRHCAAESPPMATGGRWIAARTSSVLAVRCRRGRCG